MKTAEGWEEWGLTVARMIETMKTTEAWEEWPWRTVGMTVTMKATEGRKEWRCDCPSRLPRGSGSNATDTGNHQDREPTRCEKMKKKSRKRMRMSGRVRPRKCQEHSRPTPGPPADVFM